MTEPDETRGRPLWRRVALALLFVAVAMAAITARVVVAGEGELAASTAALRDGDPIEATLRARRAAAWYAPGAPHVRVAYTRLMTLGREAERLHKTDVAVLAFEGVHEAALSTRWLVTPHAADLAEADAAIARLRSQDPRPPGAAIEPDAEVEASLLADLAVRPGPTRLASAALGTSFVALIGGLGWIVTRAVDATGRLVPGRARVGLAVAAAGLLAWIVLLLLA